MDFCLSIYFYLLSTVYTVPRGYVSLRCDEEASETSKLEADKLTDDYSRESDNIYAVHSDVKSSYYGSTNPSDEEDRESTMNMNSGEKFLHRLGKGIQGKGAPVKSSQNQK